MPLLARTILQSVLLPHLQCIPVRHAAKAAHPVSSPTCSLHHPAGKTTFLAVLRGAAGNVGRQHGRVLVNGREMRLSALRNVTGFVPQEASASAQGCPSTEGSVRFPVREISTQHSARHGSSLPTLPTPLTQPVPPAPSHCASGMQDVVHEDLTVRENLVYSARLRLSAGKPVREQLALVEDCIDLLQVRGGGEGLAEAGREAGIPCEQAATCWHSCLQSCFDWLPESGCDGSESELC